MERYINIVLRASSIWQIPVLFVLACCAIACLFGICRTIGKLSKGVLSIGAELKKINAKLEAVEVVSRDNLKEPIGEHESNSSVNAAIRDLEKLAKPRDDKG